MISKLTIGLLLVASVQSLCPAGASRSSNRPKCFQVYNFPKTFTQADVFCQSWGGHLASITNAFEANMIWESSQVQNVPNAFWIGANDLQKPGQYSWLDGSQDGYYRWSDGQPNTTNHCVATLAINGKWSTVPCSQQMPFACVFDPAQSCIAPCESKWTWNENTKSCYKVFHDVHTWQDAEAQCQTFNSHLASVHDQNENAFVNELAMTGETMKAKLQVWLGARRSPNGQWQWTDGSQTDYFYWADGEPDNDRGRESCLESYADINYAAPKGDYQQKWNDIECDSDMRASVCKKPARS